MIKQPLFYIFFVYEFLIAVFHMLLIMATKTDVENEGEDLSPIESNDLNSVGKSLHFSEEKLKFHPLRKRCDSTSILYATSPKKKKTHNIIPPTKFLLGGNISDPLNLNSLQDEDINRAMNKTPKSSPLHSNKVNIKKDQVDVLIPKNLADPLELSTCIEVNKVKCFGIHGLQKRTPQKRKQKKNLTKALSDPGLLTENTPISHDGLEEYNDFDEDISYPPIKKPKIDLLNNKISHIPKINVIEPIVEENLVLNEVEKANNSSKKLNAQQTVEIHISPPKTLNLKDKSENVIPESKELRYPSPNKNAENCKKTQDDFVKNNEKNLIESEPLLSLDSKSEFPSTVQSQNKMKHKLNKNEPKFKEKNAMFKYGNYNRYYGYRNTEEGDNRLKVLASKLDLFYGKDILDIGCNIGHVTFSVARDFGAKSVVGMDIDRKLINIARKNVQHYISSTSSQSSLRLTPNYEHTSHITNIQDRDVYNAMVQSFPISLPMLYGPINLPGIFTSGKFPFNVTFIQGNYVLESDVMLSMETCQFDVILCLSITKWIHLNWGDDGLKRAFKRMFIQLKPGGTLVLEPQSWKSYGRKKTLTDTIWRNYKTIQLKPQMFTEYLMTEVGFTHCETLSMPYNPSKGFQRPLKLYKKPNVLTDKEILKCSSTLVNKKSENHSI
ncbi:7SK snRNA methylphosphate capping enzyme-like [Daktulosphaira vitifoliae]|uniref:7SK snRNA methylphosphate capping enzyme-like n=1 Tax=Daktulosphaira vitifoliae TaxID=58002 RepID=UPI0021A9C6F3|nr:7SK snRNA methylphosphate capping enzyme-like [Daktulosphaira vitifoliae]